MKTTHDIIMNMSIGHMLTKYGKNVIDIKDIIDFGKRNSMKNIETELKRDIRSGLVRKVRNYIVVPEYRKVD